MNAPPPHASFLASGANYYPVAAGTKSRVDAALAGSFINETSPDQHPMAVRPYQGDGQQWLAHDALINLLLLINLDLGESKRRFGINGEPILEMAHIIHVAHSNFNNVLVRKTLEKAGKDPALAAFVGLAHDYIEGMESKAVKAGYVFNREAAFENLCCLWPHRADYAIIRAVVLDYMTDANSKLSKAVRVDAQREKPVAPIPSLGPIDDEIAIILNITTRENDKNFNGPFDAFLRKCFVRARTEGKISNNAPLEEQRNWGLPDPFLAGAVEQMKMKRFALLRPGVEDEKLRRYDAAMGYLKDQNVSYALRQFMSRTADVLMMRASGTPKLSAFKRATVQIASAVMT